MIDDRTRGTERENEKEKGGERIIKKRRVSKGSRVAG